MNLKTIIFIGRSGCGKGTQVKKLDEYFAANDSRKVFHLEAGDRFRKFIKGDSHTSELAHKIYDTGGLQPEFLSIWVWGGELIENIKGDEHMMVDGTPRRKSEAMTLESVFDFYGRTDVDIVYVNVSRDWAIDKMQHRGRLDDREMEDILARLNWFDTDVVPVLDFYRAHKSHRFHEINGEQEIDKVHADIVESVFND